jgi:hypothetical protein
MINITDSYGYYVATFEDSRAAFEYIFMHPSYTATNVDKPSTDRQKWAVKFIESQLNVTFKGDKENFYDCSNFISRFYGLAKCAYNEANLYS